MQPMAGTRPAREEAADTDAGPARRSPPDTTARTEPPTAGRTLRDRPRPPAAAADERDGEVLRTTGRWHSPLPTKEGRRREPGPRRVRPLARDRPRASPRRVRRAPRPPGARGARTHRRRRGARRGRQRADPRLPAERDWSDDDDQRTPTSRTTSPTNTDHTLETHSPAPRRPASATSPSPPSPPFLAPATSALLSLPLLLLHPHARPSLPACRRPASGPPASRLGCPARCYLAGRGRGVQREAVDPPSSKAQA